MPLPKTFAAVLESATPELIEAATAASAHLVLHLVGHERLSRERRDKYATILKELLKLLREEEDTRV